MELRDNDCNNCPFIDINEDRQRWLWSNGVKTDISHYCVKFNKKLRHEIGAHPINFRMMQPHERYKIERCDDCSRIGFIEKFEYNP